MEIISLDELETQTDTPTQPNSKAKFSQIKNPDNLNFTCHKNLSLSQNLYHKQKNIDDYQNVCVLYIPFVDIFCHNLIDFLPELLHPEGCAKYDLILAPYSQVANNFLNTFNIDNFKYFLNSIKL